MNKKKKKERYEDIQVHDRKNRPHFQIFRNCGQLPRQGDERTKAKVNTVTDSIKLIIPYSV